MCNNKYIGDNLVKEVILKCDTIFYHMDSAKALLELYLHQQNKTKIRFGICYTVFWVTKSLSLFVFFFRLTILDTV